eukprot:2184082-Pleurochrysis_carterae.AAC.1
MSSQQYIAAGRYKQRHRADKIGRADKSDYDNAIARARMRLLSLSELSLEVTITAMVPVMGSQKKQKLTKKRSRNRQTNTKYQQITTHAPDFKRAYTVGACHGLSRGHLPAQERGVAAPHAAYP